MLFDKEMFNATKDYSGYKFFDYYVPLLRYYGKSTAIFRALKLYARPGNNLQERIKGYKGQDSEWNSDFDKAKASMKSYRVILHRESIDLFKRYLKECSDQNIKIILVYTPECIEGQKFVENRAEVIELYKKWSKKYKVPFYDYSQDTMSFNRTYFYNASHLNKRGAELFTSKLISKLKDFEIK